MPLVILGLIVVLGAALLIYYQLGPKVTLRLKGAKSGAFGGGGDSEDTDGDSDADGDGSDESGDADGAKADGETGEADDEKVLYIFGDGGREERPLHGEGGQDGKDGGA